MLARVVNTCAGIPTSRGFAPSSTSTATRCSRDGATPKRYAAEPSRVVRPSAARLAPRIDHGDPGAGEILGVSSGEDRFLRPADGGDLGVEAVDSFAVSFAAGDQVGVDVGRGQVEGEYLAGECAKIWSAD